MPLQRITGNEIADGTVQNPDLGDGAASPRLGEWIATTSGTAHPFDIPEWANRITMNLHNVSLSGTALLRVQMGGASAWANTGYVGAGSVISSSAATASQTAGFDVYTNASSSTYFYRGTITLNRLQNNVWVASGVLTSSPGWTHTVAGSIVMTESLTRVRLFTSNGTNTFVAGQLNVQFE